MLFLHRQRSPSRPLLLINLKEDGGPVGVEALMRGSFQTTDSGVLAQTPTTLIHTMTGSAPIPPIPQCVQLLHEFEQRNAQSFTCRMAHSAPSTCARARGLSASSCRSSRSVSEPDAPE
jgi:hypothetical protein